MKKSIFFIAVLSLVGFSLKGQTVTEGIRNFWKKETGNSLSVIVQGQPDNVTDLLEKKFEHATNERVRSRRGVYYVEGVRFPQISGSTLDYYFKVDKASQGDNTSSQVSLFLSAGNYSFLNSNTHPDELYAARQILENLQYEVTVYEFELAIEEQTQTVEKALKEQEKLVKDSVALEKRLAETYEEIEKNKAELQAIMVKLQEERTKLSDFKREFARIREDY